MHGTSTIGPIPSRVSAEGRLPQSDHRAAIPIRDTRTCGRQRPLPRRQHRPESLPARGRKSEGRLSRLFERDASLWPASKDYPSRVRPHVAASAAALTIAPYSSILNGRGGISPEMAVRLSLAFGTTAESWMNQQVQYDLWHAERNRKKLRVARLSAA